MRKYVVRLTDSSKDYTYRGVTEASNVLLAVLNVGMAAPFTEFGRFDIVEVEQVAEGVEAQAARS